MAMAAIAALRSNAAMVSRSAPLLVPLRAVRAWAEEHVPGVIAARAALRPTDAEWFGRFRALWALT
jgi:hypothetical protein